MRRLGTCVISSEIVLNVLDSLCFLSAALRCSESNGYCQQVRY